MELEDLIIDEELESLIPPLTIEEFNQLEQNILEADEVRDPIIVWADHNIIIDGHNRYRILLEHPMIPYQIREMPFLSKEDVIVWMTANQLGRRNLSEVQRAILIGKAYEARKNQHPIARGENGRFVHTRQSADSRKELAQEYGVAIAEVERSGRYVRGLKEIENVLPGTTRRIQTGELEVTKKDVMALTKMEGNEKQQAIQDIANGKRIQKTEEQVTPQAEYDVSDFRSELHRKAETLDKSLELSCILTHREMLDSEEGKDALREALLEMTEVLKKYFAYC